MSTDNNSFEILKEMPSQTNYCITTESSRNGKKFPKFMQKENTENSYSKISFSEMKGNMPTNFANMILPGGKFE